MGLFDGLFGGDEPAVPQPDKGIKKALDSQAKIGQEWLDFSKQQFRVSQTRQADIDARTKEISDFFLNVAQTDRSTYESLYKPLEEQFTKAAFELDTPERQAAAAAKAKADVQTQSALQRGASEREMASVGVNPASGRYAGIDRALGLGTALGSVDAQNRAREAVRNEARGAQATALNIGRATNASSAQAASASANPVLAANQQFQASTAIPNAANAGAMQGYQNQATGLGNLYNTQANLYGTQLNANATEQAGLYSALGTAVGTGVGLYAMSDKNAKRDRKKVPEGEGLKAVEKVPVDTYRYKEGVEDGGVQTHVGPMAQDMQKVAGIGDGKAIPLQDAIGVTMQAVKDLSAKVDKIADMVGLGQPRAAMA